MSEETSQIVPSSSIDRRLIKEAAKYSSPEEMSEAVLGKLTPAQCIARVKEILASKTVFDEVEERRLLLISMAEHLEWLTDQRENEKSWPVIARMYKVLSDQVERSNVNVSDISSKLAEDHARYFTEGYMKGFDAVVKLLAERNNIVVEEDELLEVMQVGVTTSAAYIEKVTAKSVE